MFNFFKKKEEKYVEEQLENNEISKNNTDEEAVKEEETEQEEKQEQETEIKVKKIEWIEVTGYKGMTKNMTAHDGFQYELGKTYTIEDPNSVKICECGFHFSLDLKDVFNYYDLINNNRFFKVKALVRKEDYERYGEIEDYYFRSSKIDKLVAKEITILEEISDEKMFKVIKNIECNTPMIDKLEITDIPKIYDYGVLSVLTKKCYSMLQDKIKLKNSFLYFMLNGLNPNRALRLINDALILSDEIEDRDLLILSILEQKNKYIK